MNMRIPAKTFILGEYAALQGYPGLLFASSPDFEIKLSDEKILQGIHPQSPTARFWQEEGVVEKGLVFHDPYRGIGGLGASSAQFLGAYLLARGESRGSPSLNLTDLLNTYEKYTWNGQGMRPSGYDILAQLSHSFSVVSKLPLLVRQIDWPFPDVSVLLLHTGVKCVTHTHLHNLVLDADLSELGACVLAAKEALKKKHLADFCHLIATYSTQLKHHGWVAPHTEKWLSEIRQYPGVLAAKGCGAMGADVLFVLVDRNLVQACLAKIKNTDLDVLYES